MRTNWQHLERYRQIDPKLGPFVTKAGDHFGLFAFGANGVILKVIACDALAPEAQGWEHVSISVLDKKQGRTPNWKEMCYIKGLFFEGTETVVQFHPAESIYINTHKDVLHLWRCIDRDFPMPPIELV